MAYIIDLDLEPSQLSFSEKIVLLKYSVNFRYLELLHLGCNKICWEQINLTCGIFRNAISCFFNREIVFCEFDRPINALSFWQKLLMDFILIHTLKSPDLCFNRVYQRRSLWISSVVLCRDWDPLGVFVSIPNGPNLLCFEVFCWLYRSSALILMLWVSASCSTTPSPIPVGCISSAVGWETRSWSLLKLCLK